MLFEKYNSPGALAGLMAVVAGCVVRWIGVLAGVHCMHVHMPRSASHVVLHLVCVRSCLPSACAAVLLSKVRCCLPCHVVHFTLNSLLRPVHTPVCCFPAPQPCSCPRMRCSLPLPAASRRAWWWTQGTSGQWVRCCSLCTRLLLPLMLRLGWVAVGCAVCAPSLKWQVSCVAMSSRLRPTLLAFHSTSQLCIPQKGSFANMIATAVSLQLRNRVAGMPTAATSSTRINHGGGSPKRRVYAG